MAEKELAIYPLSIMTTKREAFLAMRGKEWDHSHGNWAPTDVEELRAIQSLPVHLLYSMHRCGSWTTSL
jgi:hypothetical protein